jgi:hypothetical protein
MSMDDKTQRLNEIRNLLLPFCTEHLNEELTGYVMSLLEKLGRKRVISITRGKPEIWAAAIVYVIARLNFLFDKENPYCLTADRIADFFEASKSTASQKATLIEKACNISMGEKDLCSEEISEMFEFVETPDGFILPKKWLKERITEVSFMDEEESKEFETQLAEQKKQEKLEKRKRREQLEALRRQKKAEERKEKFKDQEDLFG